MFEKLPIFYPTIYITQINPLSYNKEDIVKTIVSNYGKTKYRNKFDETSNLHHYYRDERNPFFESLDLENLRSVYKTVFDTFISSLNTNGKIDYSFQITNVAVYGDNQHLDIHDHFDKEQIFSVCHYIKIPKDGSFIRFHSPMIYTTYNNYYNSFFNEKMDKASVDNSHGMQNFDLSTLEDEMIIFPSYLKHSVSKNFCQFKDSNDLRICVVSDLYFL